MATLIDGGADAFDCLIYNRAHPGTLEFLNYQGSSFQTMLAEPAAAFFGQMENIYQRFNNSAAVRMAQAVARRMSNLLQSDGICVLSDVGQFQYATVVMQRWVMAEPTVRQMFHAQLCDGYSDTYVDAQPGAIGKDHYDYRRVTNGVYVTQPDGTFAATTWVEDLHANDSELHMAEKSDILETWSNLRSLLGLGKDDPTSRWNSAL